jgi:hypothetical protein
MNTYNTCIIVGKEFFKEEKSKKYMQYIHVFHKERNNQYIQPI